MKMSTPLHVALLSGTLLCGCNASHDTKKLPNILIILADDAGYADYGFMGCKDLPTPNIDQLAAEGTVFTDAHVSSTVCSPSRAGLLTGRSGSHFGYECNLSGPNDGLPPTEQTLAEVLKANHYRTGIVGKWHLGYLPEQAPNKRGFDYFFGMLSGARSYFYDPEGSDQAGSKRAILRNGVPAKFDGYLTDVFSDEAIQFMTEGKGKDKNKDKSQDKEKDPFFMYLSYTAVHEPMQATEADMAKFVGHPRQKLAAMTFALDRGVGKVIEALKASGQFDNTMIFFLSDNGGATNNGSSNLPYKGFKGNKFEGGQRVPFFVVWGDRFKSSQHFTGLTSALDIFATAMEVAQVDSSTLKNKLDGVSLLPYLAGTKLGNPHEMLFWHKMDSRAARAGDYKLIMTEGVDSVLYNVRNDPGEMRSLRREEPQVFQQLVADQKRWEEGCVPALWIEKGWAARTDKIHELLMHNIIFTADDLHQWDLQQKAGKVSNKGSNKVSKKASKN